MSFCYLTLGVFFFFIYPRYILLKFCDTAKYISHFKKQENKQNSEEKALSTVFSMAETDSSQAVSIVTMALTGGRGPQQLLPVTSE